MRCSAIALAASLVSLFATTLVHAHDGVPIELQASCCKDDCHYVTEVPAGVPPSRTHWSTNGRIIVCPFLNGGVRCLFVPPPRVSWRR